MLTMRDKISLSSLLILIYTLLAGSAYSVIIALQKPNMELYLRLAIILSSIIYIFFTIHSSKIIINVWKGQYKMIQDSTKQKLSFAVLHTLFNFSIIIFLIISVESSTILQLTTERKFLSVVGLLILILFTVHTARYDYNNYIEALDEDISKGTMKIINEITEKDNGEKDD